MNKLMKDIIHTADSFVENFSQNSAYPFIEKGAMNEQQPVLVAGLPDFQVSIRAWEKVKGRLTNGREDNIPFYIAGYKEHIEHAKKGDFIMVV